MRSLTRAVLSLMFVLVAVPTAAQGVPNLSGTWVMDVSKSDFGMMPAPAGRTDIIDHKEPALVIKRTTMTPNGEVASTLTYAVDGKPYVNKAGGNDISSVLKWEAATLVVVSTVETPNGQATITDRFSVSEDGKVLTQRRAINIQGQELAQTIVLAKQ
jgi:hypothetical protein